MTTSAMLLLDIFLVLSLVTLAAATVTAKEARRAVILFMAFGLVLSLAWARLQAPDLALAEAAIGAGLSGALLLAALPARQHRGRATGPESLRACDQTGQGAALRWTVSSLCVALAGVLGWALASALAQGPHETLAQSVSENLAASGVTNPVTAVLLNFRAYDTLLELAVLLTAVLGIQALAPARPGYRAAGPVYDSLTRALVPLLILTAAYLLWVGAHAPGGAFQAGATLAAAGVVLRLAGRDTAGLPPRRALPPVLAAGVAMFLAVGWSLLVAGRPFLSYPPDWAGGLILLIESAAMLAIAATLVLAFLGGRPTATRGRPLRAQAGTAPTSPHTPAPGQHRRSLDSCADRFPEHRSEENRIC